MIDLEFCFNRVNQVDLDYQDLQGKVFLDLKESLDLQEES